MDDVIVKKKKNLYFVLLHQKGCLVQVGNGIKLEAVGLQFKPYLWLPCGVTWDSSLTVVVISCCVPLPCSAREPTLQEYL